MTTQADKNSENKTQAQPEVAQLETQEGEPSAQFMDSRPQPAIQRILQEAALNSPQARQAAKFQGMAKDFSAAQRQPIQRRENKTDLPDQLKQGIEHLSGYSMDDVKVHRNSDKPAQLQAHAYAQGADIHLGPGQEKHLPHEAWHVVQQKQGRVRPTLQMHNMAVNNDSALEREADMMGNRVLGNNEPGVHSLQLQGLQEVALSDAPIQGFWKELFISALLLLSPVGLISNERAGIRRRPLDTTMGALAVSNQLGLPSDAVSAIGQTDMHPHPENFGPYHEQIFLDEDDPSQNVGMFASGIGPEAEEFFESYDPPVVDNLDSNVMKLAVNNIREAWEAEERTYHLTKNNCQVFADEVLQEYYRLFPSLQPEKSWSVWVAEKFVAFDDEFVGHLNSMVISDLDKKIPDLKKSFLAKKDSNQFAGLVLVELEAYCANNNYCDPIRGMLNDISSELSDKETNLFTKESIKKLVAIGARQDIESNFPDLLMGTDFGETLYEAIVDKITSEIHRRISL